MPLSDFTGPLPTGPFRFSPNGETTMTDAALIERSDALARKLLEAFRAGDRDPRAVRLLRGIVRPVDDPERWPVQHDRSEALGALLTPAERTELGLA